MLISEAEVCNSKLSKLWLDILLEEHIISVLHDVYKILPYHNIVILSSLGEWELNLPQG